ncbi:hypothetical protein SLITK23_34230 [Streptomyces lividans]|nr:hypothetical protein TR66_15405 [Streptomyces sp. WM6391]BDE40178.1 hypothetical protein SLITK23_34230 [Streptomyces lividans]GHA30727.1 hypothetical protein GCM10010391_13000 [Streptomyces anthocyanicus]
MHAVRASAPTRPRLSAATRTDRRDRRVRRDRRNATPPDRTSVPGAVADAVPAATPVRHAPDVFSALAAFSVLAVFPAVTHVTGSSKL